MAVLERCRAILREANRLPDTPEMSGRGKKGAADQTNATMNFYRFSCIIAIIETSSGNADNAVVAG